MDAFKIYFEQIKKLDVADATEHTLRPALQNLLASIAKENPLSATLQIIHEPKKDTEGKGAPDFKIKKHECIVGYLENKKTDQSLDRTLKSDQIVKYKKLSNNLIVTNYLEWVWLRDGVINRRETLCYESDVGNRKARLDPDKAEKVAQLIAAFLSTPPKGIARSKDLALALATRCHDLREFLAEELIRQEHEHQQGKLFGLFGIFKKDVFHELDLAGFADAFAQTLGYGLFLAKLNCGHGNSITLQNAKNFIPVNFELIRELVDFLDELEHREYSLIKWLIEEILSILNTLDLAAITEDLAFAKRQGSLLEATAEERLIFSKDPYIYFYEDFLKSYDPQMRKSRGVYYTPPPVVNLIVRAVNDTLKFTFNIKQGLADRKKVTVLDFATGTGTFLLEVLYQIFETVSPGVRDQVIHEHVLKNLYGFEYLIAPYTIAHLKLSQFLHDKDYHMRPTERLQIYLTNTLEPINPEPNFLVPALSREVEHAQEIKEKPILVITGNPPYSGESKNNGKWITKEIAKYRFVDGKPLGESNPRWLQNDYVKFIRFAQNKMDSVDEGVVGVITAHSFLDNPTFRGMRQSLMSTFDQIYIIDLHGNLDKKEKTPDGSKDENVFDIETGVCVSILVRKKGLTRHVKHCDFWGKRGEKYRKCLESSISSLDWADLSPHSPHYLFRPHDTTGQEEYDLGWKITDIFPIHSNGIVTARDHLCIQFTESDAKAVVKDFEALPIEDARRKYKLGKDVRDWKVDLAQKDLRISGMKPENIVPINYRPFDLRYTYYTPNSRGFICMPRNDVMKHLVKKSNIALVTTRMTKGETFKHVLVTNHISEAICLSSSTSNNGFVFPLYAYADEGEQKPHRDLYQTGEHFDRPDVTENFSAKFRLFIDKKYGKHYSPEAIFGYIFAILSSESYRKKYVAFLAIDFPIIPFPNDQLSFEKLSAIGWDLAQVHIFHKAPTKPAIQFPKKGDNIVGDLAYDASTQKLFVNKTQFFYPVLPAVWQFCIGGYQVLEKFLKYRKGRELSLDENENLVSAIKAIEYTIDAMAEIEAAWRDVEFVAT